MCRLTVLGLLLFVAIVFIAALEVSVTFSLRHIPGPRAWPLIGHIPYLLKEPWRVFYEFSNKYGIVYVIRLWFKPMLVVSDPELVKIMFREREKLYLKDQWSYEFFRYLLSKRLKRRPIALSDLTLSAEMFWAGAW